MLSTWMTCSQCGMFCPLNDVTVNLSIIMVMHSMSLRYEVSDVI